MMKAGSLVSDAEYMSLAMKDSLWYGKSGREPVKVNMEKWQYTLDKLKQYYFAEQCMNMCHQCNHIHVLLGKGNPFHLGKGRI
eukprot:15366029-Ditylum_brightwellii.AAC.1